MDRTRRKKGWDIVTGLSIPLVVFVGGIWFNSWNSQQQQEVAEQKQKDELLKTYINDMKGFLLDKEKPLKEPEKNEKLLKEPEKNDEVRGIARTITLTTLTQLNSEKDEQRRQKGMYNKRKGLIMQFLFESRLIQVDPQVDPQVDLQVDPIISLSTADFTFANLENANLENAELIDANLENANLENANLGGANLKRANLNDAELNDAELIDALTFPVKSENDDSMRVSSSLPFSISWI